MHNTFYFIRQLSSELNMRLSGARVEECFSQEKEELVIEIKLSDGSPFYIQAVLHSDFSTLYFPEEFKRARQNVRPYFPELNNKKILAVVQAEYERSFALYLEGDFMLVFKLHGNRANLILLQDNKVLKLFKNSLHRDKEFNFSEFHKEADLGKERFDTLEGNLQEFNPLFSENMRLYLKEQSYDTSSLPEKWNKVQELLSRAEHPEYCIAKKRGKIFLSLFPMGEVLEKCNTALAAANAFYRAHFKYNFFDLQKAKLIQWYQQRIKFAQKQQIHLKQRLNQLQTEIPPSQIADIIMANLHAIAPNTEEVELLNFYSNEPIKIRLKKNMSPQKFAESLYRKSKNRHIEIEQTNKNIQRAEQNEQRFLQKVKEIETTEDYKILKSYLEEISKKKRGSEEEEDKFKEFEYQGFRIYVGRNASNNDELTQGFAKKDDLWLHARDVSGSHVVIKQILGKPFPKSVIEAAASLAAWYSKRKNESLCPVIYTPKKYVRKLEGAPKGSVRVDQEKVIMVVPKENL